VKPLLSLSALSAPLLSTSLSNSNECVLTDSDIETFLQDLARRFDPTGELDGILGPVITIFLSHESLFRPEGLGGADTTWRSVLSGLEVLASIKPIAIMMTRMENWIPEGVSPENFEKFSLLGPLCRLGVFPNEWVGFHMPWILLLLVEILRFFAAGNCAELFLESR
jgi:ubiquitin conjugation factor E4 B